MGKYVMMSSMEAQHFTLIQQVLVQVLDLRCCGQRPWGYQSGKSSDFTNQVREHGALGLIFTASSLNSLLNFLLVSISNLQIHLTP